MVKTVDAIYEQGHLRLMEPLKIAEGAAVKLSVEVDWESQQETNGAIAHQVTEAVMIPLTIDPYETAKWLAEIAALPIEGDSDKFSGRDHDTILYGERGAR
jgi:predicted DNA-binding antitoxin AbrB/MazE fold protein